MFLILWVVIGVITGFAVHTISNQRRPALVADIVLGTVGAVVGGFVFNVAGRRGVTQLDLVSLPCAGLGALLVLGGFHMLRRTGLGFR